MVEGLVTATLNGMGFDVVSIGQATTPTTEIAVVMEKPVAASLSLHRITRHNGMP